MDQIIYDTKVTETLKRYRLDIDYLKNKKIT